MRRASRDLFHRAARLLHGGGRLLDSRGGFFRHGRDVPDGLHDPSAAARDFGQMPRSLRDLIRHLRDGAINLVEGGSGRLDLRDAFPGLVAAMGQGMDDLARFAQNAVHDARDFGRGPGRMFGELADFVGDDGESSAVLSRL